MGNFQTEQAIIQQNNQKRIFLKKVNKVSQGYLQKFGKFDIYQLHEKPYDYYIQYLENIVPNSQMMNLKFKFYQNLPTNKNLVPIQYIQTFKRKQKCAEFDGLRMFCTYYNFTLEDGIKLKIKQKNNFVQAEAIYILKSLLSIGKFYQNQLKSKFYCGIYKTKNIFISPQGHIKIYPFNDSAFLAYVSNRQSQESSFQLADKKSFELTDKKQSTELIEDKMKPFYQTRDQSSIFKSSFYKSRQGFKKPKLFTTLKKQRADPILTSQQILKLRGIQSQKISRNVSNTILSHQQSSQTFNYLFQNLNQDKGSNKQDLFQLGILMMQVLLLNQHHQYYKQKSSNNQHKFPLKKNRQSNRTNNTLYTVQQQNDQTCKRYKHLQEYQNQNGLIPNLDLIYFSLKKLLPKKNISRFLLQFIQMLIIGEGSNNLEYDQLYQHIQRQQQLCPRIKYCLKFQNNKQDKFEKYQTTLMNKIKNQNILNRTTEFNNGSYGVHTSVLDKNVNNGESIDQNQYESQNVYINSPSKKLQDFLSYNNLSRSVVIDEDLRKDSQYLSHLKKSRKLVPHRIRSISMKLNQQNKIAN